MRHDDVISCLCVFGGLCLSLPASVAIGSSAWSDGDEGQKLGSKSAHTATSAAAVDLKVLIEQMREQVQNIE